jgi:circadian clock protein KaiB
MIVYQLRLYITGHTAKSENAIANLQRICSERLHSQCEIEVVDVLEQPEIAETEKILATPTLVKQSPQPSRRVIGDLSDLDQVIQGLGLQLIPASRKSTEDFQAGKFEGVK